jgi:F-type H+-transporting ATPase subunit b
MKRDKTKTCRSALVALMALVFLLVVTAVEVMAAEGGGGWRPTYDIIMKWVNFAILVLVFIKFARRPLKNFLSDKGEEIALQINSLQDEKNRLQQRILEAKTELEESAVRLEAVKKRIVEMGERRKQEIIDEARREGGVIIESAKQKMEGRIIRERNRLKEEMIDAATEMALEKLPGLMTENDNQKLLEQFLAHATEK